MSAKNYREFLIAGGGIGGLAAALALAKRGMRARVMERAAEFGEIGYGIQLGPNAYRMLDFLGVAKEVEETAVHPDFLVLVDALTDKELTRISCGDVFKARYGAPYMVVHRRDLHGALLKACQAREEISLHTSKELTGFAERSDGVVAKFADGTEYECAALVGADGLRSRVREHVVGDGNPRVAGHVTYRGVVPIDQIHDKTHFNNMTIWIGPDLHLVQYRLQGGTVMNNVATVISDKFRKGVTTDFGGPDELKEVFSHTTAKVQDMLSYVGTDKNWVLHDREPVPNWTQGRVTLLGDAAHPTLQYLAQGACMAIEDGVVLSKELAGVAGVTGVGDINAALVSYQEQRYLRTARVQLTARIFGDIIHTRGGARDLRNHLMAQRTPETFTEVDWLYRGIEAG
jgi:salicylate hydroxylase